MPNYANDILHLINTSYDHYTADQIYEKLHEQGSKVVLATVYNNLNTLCEQHLVRRVIIGDGPDRFDRVERHDHLVCNVCGELSDIKLEDLTKHFEEETHCKIESYDLSLFYVCPKCRKKDVVSECGGDE